MDESTLARFMSRVKKSDGCWEWQGEKVNGYGRFALGYVGNKPIRARAHRLSYEHFVGSAEGLVICHRCDNPLCVRPDHLFAGSMKDNMQDAASKNRMYRGGANVPWTRALTHCKRGHELSAANLVNTTSGRRVCKACMSLKRSAQYRREKAAANPPPPTAHPSRPHS